ncbi:MFS general substrate transporter [Linderina pennispora]|uniref:MFS general substrate transporter n=1 Tax=Linderina pennispora TaxID=61395 RepID=A0A1Y1VX94_9FUNG|nr:MFS general substrate transporter [Linderina pennispora]ORX65902.1 MFS general substrate transporter [Linderina pennispora]
MPKHRDNNDIEAHNEWSGALTNETEQNATLNGVKKKMVTRYSRFDKILIAGGIFFINFVAAMDSSATGTIQPAVLSEFNALTRAGIISTVTYLLVAGLRPIFAKISEVYGHIHGLFISMFFYTLGLLICALSKSFTTIFAGTIISVIGQAGYGTLVTIIIADVIPIHLRGIITAWVSIPYVTNYYLGIEVGDGLIKKWQWVYGIPGNPGLLFRLDRRARQILKGDWPVVKEAWVELDILGLILLCGGCISILAPLGMQLNTTYGWGSARVIAPLVIGVAALVLFAFYERLWAQFPVVPFHLFKHRTFTGAILAGIFFYVTSNVSLFFFNPFIQVTREVSSRTAMLLQLSTTGYYVGLFLGGWAMQWSRRYRRWAWIGWAMWLISVCLMIRSRSGSHTTNAEIAAVQAIIGVGSGIVISCVGIGVQASVSKTDVPIAVTLYGMVAYLGGVIGEGVSTTVWVNVLPSKINSKLDPSVDSFSAINNITYFFELPKDQRVIVQEGYLESPPKSDEDGQVDQTSTSSDSKSIKK